MREFYNDLDKVYNKLTENIALLEKAEKHNIEKDRLVAWMKATLRELQVDVQALAENKLSTEALKQ